MLVTENTQEMLRVMMEANRFKRFDLTLDLQCEKDVSLALLQILCPWFHQNC
jgi:hypothetical protein